VHQWSKRFGGTLSDRAEAIAVDVSGNSCITGYFNGTVDFGGGALTSAGGTDVFLLRLDLYGAHWGSQRFGDTGTDVGYSTAFDDFSGYCVTGVFNGTVNFGGGALTSAGGSDIFVAGTVTAWRTCGASSSAAPVPTPCAGS